MYLQKISKKSYFFYLGMFFPAKKCYTTQSIFIYKGETYEKS